MSALRKRLDEELNELNTHGGDRRSENNIIYNVEMSKPELQGTSRAYRIARLKRDAPDIAERVI